MTLGEGKRKVLMLLDEYSSSGAITVDQDLELRMADFFDLAQKHIAGYKRIVRSFAPAAPEGLDASGRLLCPAPSDFGQVFRVWRDGKLTSRYAWRGKSILLPAEDVGGVVVEYFAIPATIPQDAPDTYAFEVDEDAAACMPYFVAAQQLVVDLVVDPAPLMDLYDRMLAALDIRLPSPGGGGVRQSFYSNGRRRGTWPGAQV